jgi:hypothetical protein
VNVARNTHFMIFSIHNNTPNVDSEIPSKINFIGTIDQFAMQHDNQPWKKYNN